LGINYKIRIANEKDYNLSIINFKRLYYADILQIYYALLISEKCEYPQRIFIDIILNFLNIYCELVICILTYSSIKEIKRLHVVIDVQKIDDASETVE